MSGGVVSGRDALAKALHAAREEGVRALYPDAHDSTFESWDMLDPSSRSTWLVAADALSAFLAEREAVVRAEVVAQVEEACKRAEQITPEGSDEWRDSGVAMRTTVLREIRGVLPA